MQAFSGFLAFLVLGAVANVSTVSMYRVDLKGGGAYWTSAKPSEQSGRYVFRTTGGTLVSVRESDVAGIRRSVRVVPSPETNLIGMSSPAAAARNQKLYAGRLHDLRRTGTAPAPPLNRQDPYFRQSPYRPGVGEAYPASPNDYTVGKTFAYPPSGKVYEGLPPNKTPEEAPMSKVLEGPAPELQTPPPPPPNR